MKEGPDTKNDQHIKEIFKEKQNENLTSYRVGVGNPFFFCLVSTTNFLDLEKFNPLTNLTSVGIDYNLRTGKIFFPGNDMFILCLFLFFLGSYTVP